MQTVCGRRAASAFFVEIWKWRRFTISKLDHQLNEEIRDKEVRVIGADWRTAWHHVRRQTALNLA